MGSVKISTQVDEVLWRFVNLSTIDSINGLLKHGCRMKDWIVFKNNSATLLKENNYELLCLYIWLDEMIKKCSFNNKQKEILQYYYLKGYNEKEIAEIFNNSEINIRGIIKSICKKILKQVKLNYKLDYLYWNKVKVEQWKTCSKCGFTLPATEEFFSPDNRNKDGLYSVCKECWNNYIKKPL